MAAAALSACIAVSPAAAAEPFLTATGAHRCRFTALFMTCHRMHVGHHFVAPLSSSRRHHCLTCAGAQGLLRDQEAELFRLREEKEGQVHNSTGSNE